MLDTRLRGIKDRALAPLARALGPALHPHLLSVLGLVFGLAAFGLALRGVYGWGLAAFATNRLLDGLDGAQARHHDLATELGGYLDLLFDFLVYALVPLGLALSLSPDRGVLVALGVLLTTFYVNAASWMILSTLLERRGGSGPEDPHRTTLAMPNGLVEGAETTVLLVLFFLLPHRLTELFWVTSGLVAITAAQRVAWALRHLPR